MGGNNGILPCHPRRIKGGEAHADADAGRRCMRKHAITASDKLVWRATGPWRYLEPVI